jgi:hypothetical protein
LAEPLRKLLGTLDLESGIVATVAGRERPRWSEAGEATIPEGYLEYRLVGELSRADAERYLESVGIDEAKMRRFLSEYAQVAPDRVHPLYLGLCADVVLSASKRGERITPEEFQALPEAEDKGAAIVGKLLHYADEQTEYAVLALSACRAFDKEIYFKLGEKLHFGATEPGLNSLIRFSFVSHLEQYGSARYRIHDLIRRLVRERGELVTRRADEVLEAY